MKRTLVFFGLIVLLLSVALPVLGQTHPYDEPGQAKKMKLPNLPSMVNIYTATVSGSEPVDPLAPALTNTVWAKFTLTTKRVVGFQNFYYNAGTLFFSLFTKSGPTYTPATGTIFSFNDIMLATLNPGTYFLRIGIVGEPAGTESTFITFTGIAYLMPATYDFSAGLTEGTVNANVDSTGWKVKNATPGPGGDVFSCETASPYDCYFQFASVGANETTKLISNVVLKDVKLKKGDVIRVQPSLSDVTGQPNFTTTLVLTNATGAKQVYAFNVTDGSNTEPNLTAVVPAAFIPVKATLTIKNKDTDIGDLVEIDGVIVAAIRAGEALRNTLNIPLFGSIPAAWVELNPKGALPAPLPPQ